MYAHLVFTHLDADWLAGEAMERHVPRIRTPPYLSNTPDVYHVPLDGDGGVLHRKATELGNGGREGVKKRSRDEVFVWKAMTEE